MDKKNYELKSLRNTNKKDSLIGETIEFGYNPKSDSRIEWTVIAENNDSMLLWSKDIIKDITFSKNLRKDDYNLYQNSDIKKYLNNEFVKLFSTSELEYIDDFGKDQFYILSEDDLTRYLSIDYHKENEALRAKPDNLLYSNGFETNESGYGKYWLKNYDSKHDYAKIIDSFGNITRAKINNPNVGIRVAVWIKKNKKTNLIEHE